MSPKSDSRALSTVDYSISQYPFTPFTTVFVTPSRLTAGVSPRSAKADSIGEKSGRLRDLRVLALRYCDFANCEFDTDIGDSRERKLSEPRHTTQDSRQIVRVHRDRLTRHTAHSQSSDLTHRGHTLRVTSHSSRSDRMVVGFQSLTRRNSSKRSRVLAGR